MQIVNNYLIFLKTILNMLFFGYLGIAIAQAACQLLGKSIDSTFLPATITYLNIIVFFVGSIGAYALFNVLKKYTSLDFNFV